MLNNADFMLNQYWWYMPNESAHRKYCLPSTYLGFQEISLAFELSLLVTLNEMTLYSQQCCGTCWTFRIQLWAPCDLLLMLPMLVTIYLAPIPYSSALQAVYCQWYLLLLADWTMGNLCLSGKKSIEIRKCWKKQHLLIVHLITAWLLNVAACIIHILYRIIVFTVCACWMLFDIRFVFKISTVLTAHPCQKWCPIFLSSHLLCAPFHPVLVVHWTPLQLLIYNCFSFLFSKEVRVTCTYIVICPSNCTLLCCGLSLWHIYITIKLCRSVRPATTVSSWIRRKITGRSVLTLQTLCVLP